MTATTTDPAIRELPLSRSGEVLVRIAAGRIRLRGIDEPLVRIRSADGRDLARLVAVSASPDRVVISRVPDDSNDVLRIGPIRVGRGGSAELDIEVPRDAAVSVQTASADVTGDGLAGAIRVETASGDATLRVDGGPVAVRTVSGDIRVEASAAIACSARSVSGDLHVRAPRFEQLGLGSTSGDIEATGAIANGQHVIETVSGDVRLATGSEVRVDTRTVTGDITTAVPHRREGGGGFGASGALIVGAGRAVVRWHSMSGDFQLLDGPTGGAPAPTAPPPAPELARAPAPSSAAAPAPWVVAEGSAQPNRVDDREAISERAERAGRPARVRTGDQDAARLDVLRAVERGELTIEEAASRLDALDGPGALSSAGWV